MDHSRNLDDIVQALAWHDMRALLNGADCKQPLSLLDYHDMLFEDPANVSLSIELTVTMVATWRILHRRVVVIFHQIFVGIDLFLMQEEVVKRRKFVMNVFHMQNTPAQATFVFRNLLVVVHNIHNRQNQQIQSLIEFAAEQLLERQKWENFVFPPLSYTCTC